MDTAQSLAFKNLLTEAIKRQASDLHMSVGSHPMLRIDGTLVPLEDEELLTVDGVRLVIDAVLTTEQKTLFLTTHDIIFTTVFDNRIRAKIHAFQQEGFPTLSLRFLSLHVKTLKELNAPPPILKCAEMTEGLIVVGGANGSGRTTLAMGILEQINRTRVEHILTLENPIEYNMLSNKGIVNQREIGTDVVSLDAALEYAQKEDVDVLFIGELATAKHIRSCLELAASGMLVIAVMNVNSSAMALEKIISSFEQHEQQHIQSLLADVLKMVVVQALLPRIGGGSVMIHELLLNTQQVKSLIISNRFLQLDGLIKSSRSDGMMSFDHELADHVRARELSPEMARLHARTPETLDLLVKG